MAVLHNVLDTKTEDFYFSIKIVKVHENKRFGSRSRGFGVLDLNYRGSTGYGRAYQDKLLLQWGIVDVEDAVNGAEYLVEQGKADSDRLAIRGGSAGGYTTLSITLHFRVRFLGVKFYIFLG